MTLSSRRETPRPESLLRGLPIEVAEAARQWLQENRPAMDAWNEYVERQGLPLAEFRQF
jgi:post-segregation antitoxin (ccd killing protein)